MAVVDARTTITLSKISCTSEVVMIPPSPWGISDLRGHLIYPPDENPLRMKWDTVTNKIGQGPKMELFPPLQEDTIFTCLTVLLCILILILMFSQLSQAMSALTWVQQQWSRNLRYVWKNICDLELCDEEIIVQYAHNVYFHSTFFLAKTHPFE